MVLFRVSFLFLIWAVCREIKTSKNLYVSESLKIYLIKESNENFVIDFFVTVLLIPVFTIICRFVYMCIYMHNSF